MSEVMRHQQLSAVLREAIADGEWGVGDELPSTRELASAHSVSTTTVNAALAALERAGLILRRPNRRALVRGTPQQRRARQIAVLVMPDALADPASAPWQLTVSAAADASMLEAGFSPVRVALWPRETADLRGAVNRMMEQLLEAKVAGVVLLGRYQGSRLLAEGLDREGLPWVSLRPLESGMHSNFVGVDFRSAGYTLGRAMLACGRRNLVYLNSSPGRQLNQPAPIFDGLQAAHLDAGEDNRGIRFLHCDDHERETGREVVARHLASESAPHGIVTTGDLLALGAMDACRQHGLRVPGDVAVVGGTGSDVAAHAHPSLTTIAQPMTGIGRALARYLLRAIHEGVHSFPGRELPADIVVRESFPIPRAVMDQLNAAPITPEQRVVADGATEPATATDEAATSAC
ncbi:MAG: GntR family transcriptional regulator [bacterium]